MGGDGVRLANPLMHFWSRGPGKALADSVTRAVDRVAPPAQASENVVQAIQRGLAQDTRCLTLPSSGIPAVGCDLRPAFADPAKGWAILEANADRGFSGASFWARDPQGRRVMIKLQDLPEGAANERLAYSLGRTLKLPVNEVQVGLWQGKLVSLHYDVARPGERALPFLDLPAGEQAALLQDPRLVRMGVFDRIIQNADRNPRNILVTKPWEGGPAPPGIHLIDHANSFGMGLLDFVSLYATKFKVRPLAVAHFSPGYEARSFHRYLASLTPEQWTQARPLLRRFGSLSDARLEALLAEIKDVVPPDHLARVRQVLQLKRDIARVAARSQRPPVWLPPRPRRALLLGPQLNSPARGGGPDGRDEPS